METNNEIKLVQKPIISHELKAVGQSIAKRLEELNLPNLIANEDTLKYLKETRATLNKEFDILEKDRKILKTALNEPYNEFEQVYKEEVTDRYTPALSLLKDKVSSVEIKIKDEKKEAIKSYFVELCLSENIDFVCFDQLNLDINISTTEKAYKEKCNEFIAKVQDDLRLIKSMDFEVEIMAEYKSTLNVSKSIQDIKDRKERERVESERVKLIEQNRRVAEFKRLGMVADTETKSFVFNTEIYVSWDSVKDIDKVAFSNKIVELEEKIKASKKAEPTIEFKTEEQSPVGNKPIEVIQAPKVEPKLEILKAVFEVEGTMAQLKALSDYLKQNKLNYKNI
jgi:hypothetical protein